MKIKQAVTLISSLILAQPAMNMAIAAERWFEVEVILVSQLGDKTKLKEAFPESSSLPTYRRSYDLLTPYLNPDINTLKQQLPACDSNGYPSSLLEQASELPLFPSLKTIEEIELTTELLSEQRLIVEQQDVEQQYLDPTTVLSQETRTDPFAQEMDDDQDTSITITDTNADLLLPPESEELLPLTKEQADLVIAAQQEFSAHKFNYSAPNSYNTMCIIDEHTFNDINPDSSIYSYQGFTVTEMPRTISAAEDLFSKQPYLLNQASLKLDDIVKQLRRSKNFRPMLHLGWRQPVYSERRARAIQLFAGSNLQSNYQSAQAIYNQQQQQLLEEEDTISNILNSSSEQVKTGKLTSEIDIATQINQAKTTRLTEILARIDSIESADTAISSLSQDLTLALENQTSMMDSAPLPPIQPWFIDGFLRVHLHRNYLNITADFNVLNQTLAQQETLRLKPTDATSELNELKAIRFQQRRRVISKQIHYFDHPYLGMIVQIRTHKRPQKPVAAPVDNTQ